MLRHARSLIARLRLDQRGQSLVEVLITAALTAVVLGALGTLLITSQRQQQKNTNYDFAQAGAQTELDTMIGQVRAAWNIVSWGPNSVDFDVNIGGSPYQVYYECDVPAGNGWNKCVRLQLAVGAAVPSLTGASTVIPRLSNGTTSNPVFTWQSEATAPTVGTTTVPLALAPDYVTATVDVPASNGVTDANLSINRTIAFSDGALIRNVDVEN